MLIKRFNIATTNEQGACVPSGLEPTVKNLLNALEATLSLS